MTLGPKLPGSVIHRVLYESLMKTTYRVIRQRMWTLLALQLRDRVSRGLHTAWRSCERRTR